MSPGSQRRKRRLHCRFFRAFWLRRSKNGQAGVIVCGTLTVILLLIIFVWLLRPHPQAHWTPETRNFEYPPEVLEQRKRQAEARLTEENDNDEDSFAHTIWHNRSLEVKAAMAWAWKGYSSYAWGSDHLHPLSKSFDNTFQMGLTLIDSLDTLHIMGMTAEFDDAREWVATKLDFNAVTVNVNLFETTIRVLGSLLSTYSLTEDKVFLDKAVDLADRLMLAFKTQTGVPLTDVNLAARKAKELATSSTSEVATIQMEFKYLSYLTGDDKYDRAVQKVMDVIDKEKPSDGLVPMNINAHTGKFAGNTITLGARGDSYYEYLLKVWLLTSKEETRYKEMYKQAMDSVLEKLVSRTPNGRLFISEMTRGGVLHPKMDHLVCFLAGTLALGTQHGFPQNHMEVAEELAETCYLMYKEMKTGLAPEIMQFNTEGERDMWAKPNDKHNLLRPETVESLFVLWRITGKERYREWGYDIFKAFETHTRVETGGYASLQNADQLTHNKRDKMESFFLAETLKYLYLLFTEDLSLCDLDKIVFNTEAHPFPKFRRKTT